MRRRGIGRATRPSLIGTAARTAVITKTATTVAGNTAAKQQAKAAQAQAAQAAPAPPAPAPAAAEPAGGLTDELVDQLTKLGQLRDSGILTEDEFSAKKAKLLGL